MEKVQENVVGEETGELRWGEKMERDTLAMAGHFITILLLLYVLVFWPQACGIFVP